MKRQESVPGERQLADRPDFSRYRYIVIDDNRHMVVLLKAILKSFGAVDIAEFRDAAEAAERMKTTPFDIALVDYLMEPLNGLDFIRRIRGDENGVNRRTAILMVSAHTDRKVVLAARNAGANAVLAKPVSPNQLLRYLLACMLKPLPFIVSPTYVGPCRTADADTSLVALWEKGETLPPGVEVLPPQPLPARR
jgi:CheY-like chemotaxis protein